MKYEIRCTPGSRVEDKLPTYLGLYGNVSIQKALCDKCGSYAFILDGRLACCGRVYTERPTIYKREIEPQSRRRRLPLAARREQIKKQEGCCLYCQRRFGSYVFRGIKTTILRVCWDHSIPFAYAYNNQASNFVASCQICNSIKHDKIFQTLEDARVNILASWAEKGYSDSIGGQ